MDPELSLIMANMALVKPGSFVLDPFVGTGSFLISCSHFGAFTIGADIDGRQLRGKGIFLLKLIIKQSLYHH
jgi:tRNA (guanine10-N2)-methyltransferase